MANETLVRVAFPSVSGLPRDVYVNDFAVRATGALTQAICDEIASDIMDHFYNLADGSLGGETLSNFMSNVIDRGADKVKLNFYDVSGALGGGPVGSPAFISTGTLGGGFTGGSHANMPSAVAAIVSFHSDLTGVSEVGPIDAAIPTPEAAQDMGAPATHSGHTKPKARRRGRIYVGPLLIDCAATSAGDVFVDINFQNILLNAASGLLAELNTGEWCVWSKRDAAFRAVTGGFISNGFATVRKRQAKANGRTAF